MKLYHVSTGPLRVNTYFLVNEGTKNAVVIDSGESYNKVKETAKNLGVKIKAVLLTHAHFDHTGSAKKLQDDGAEIFISKTDAPKLLNDDNLSKTFGRNFDYVTADYTFFNGDVLVLEGMRIEVIATPGHTDGSVTFKYNNMLFTGDTLFYECIGRTDFKTGNRRELVNSVKKLFQLSGDYAVYPGHDGFTTLEHERKNNRFVDYD